MTGGNELGGSLRLILMAVFGKSPLGGLVDAAPLPGELGMTDPAFTEGCAQLQARGLLVCQLSTTTPPREPGLFPYIVQLTPTGLITAPQLPK